MSAIQNFEALANSTNRLPADAWTSEHVSNEALRALFETAMFDVTVDGDGDVVIRDKYRIFASVRKNRPIRFMCVFGFRESASQEARFVLCNRINDGLVIIRASAHGASKLLIDWYLPTRGGITKKAVVLALRQFSDLVGSMSEYDTDDIIE